MLCLVLFLSLLMHQGCKTFLSFEKESRSPLGRVLLTTKVRFEVRPRCNLNYRFSMRTFIKKKY
jgi:hypothetical protein